MQKFLACTLIFFSTTSFANTRLKPLMQSTCEQLGATHGAKCVELQRTLERQNAYLDENGASICQLIWQWASRSGDTSAAGDLVLSCFQQVSNLKISDEVKETCNQTVYSDQGSIASMSTVKGKVKNMMSCLAKVGVRIPKTSR